MRSESIREGMDGLGEKLEQNRNGTDELKEELRGLEKRTDYDQQCSWEEK